MPVSIILRSQQAKTLKRHPFLKHLRVRVDKGKRYENACVDENIFSLPRFRENEQKTSENDLVWAGPKVSLNSNIKRNIIGKIVIFKFHE